MTTITAVTGHDLRFPTSITEDGSDAMNHDGDCSTAAVVLHTRDPALSGSGFAFTIGCGNDLGELALFNSVWLEEPTSPDDFPGPMIVENGCHGIPAEAGYSAEIHSATIESFAYPTGTYRAVESVSLEEHST